MLYGIHLKIKGDAGLNDNGDLEGITVSGESDIKTSLESLNA